MKFTVNREKLQKALQRVGNIIGSRSMLLLLSNVLLQAEDGKLRLSTTDVEMRISTLIDADVAEPGQTTLPARKLTQLTGCFSAPDVLFEIDDKDHARISCGTAKFTLLGLPAADFPEAASFDAGKTVKIKKMQFKRNIGSCLYAVSADDSRKALTGVLLSIRDGVMTMVATDGKRMAIQECAPESLDGGDGDVVIPLKAMSEARRLLDGDGDLTLEIGDKFCRFSAENFMLSTKLIEGTYPNYRQVVPSAFKQVVELPVQLLLSKIESVALMLSETTGFVILRFGENQLQLKASSAEVGEGSDLIEAAYEGEPLEVSFNPAFLVDPLRNTDADMVRFKINDPLSPVALEAGEGFIYIIMPLRKK